MIVHQRCDNKVLHLDKPVFLAFSIDVAVNLPIGILRILGSTF